MDIFYDILGSDNDCYHENQSCRQVHIDLLSWLLIGSSDAFLEIFAQSLCCWLSFVRNPVISHDRTLCEAALYKDSEGHSPSLPWAWQMDDEARDGLTLLLMGVNRWAWFTDSFSLIDQEWAMPVHDFVRKWLI